MNCNDYTLLIREAARDESPAALRNPKLQAHLAECGACRQELEVERRLARAIDAGVAARVAGSAPEDFAARLRDRLQIERDSKRAGSWWRPRVWIPVTVFAAAALLLGIGIVRHPRRPATRFVRTVKQVVPNVPGPTQRESPGRPAMVARAQAHPRSKPAETAIVRRIETAGHPKPLEVIVQPGEWAAIVALERAANSPHVQLAALPDAVVDDDKPITPQPVEIKPIVIADLFPAEPASQPSSSASQPASEPEQVDR